MGNVNDMSAPYAITPQEHAKYQQLFVQYDTNADGFLSGAESVAVFKLSGLDRSVLRSIWTLADDDKDNQLNSQEFCVGFHLILCVSKKKLPLPATLPPELKNFLLRANSVPTAPHKPVSVSSAYEDFDAPLPEAPVPSLNDFSSTPPSLSTATTSLGASAPATSNPVKPAGAPSLQSDFVSTGSSKPPPPPFSASISTQQPAPSGAGLGRPSVTAAGTGTAAQQPALAQRQPLAEHSGRTWLRRLGDPNEITKLQSVDECEDWERILRNALESVEKRKANIIHEMGKQNEAKLCVVCQVKEKTVVLFPCRHLCLCQACSILDQIRQCPLCRQRIEQRVGIYS